jgi:hypothetical protein
MERGDIVRLKRPFRPAPNCPEEYSYGVVVGLVEVDGGNTQLQQPSQLSEVVLQLYKPETATVYTDELGTQPMFYFRMSELDL